VPEIIAADRTRGWFLLTDLGSAELADAYGTEDESAALSTALSTLIQLQSVDDPVILPYTRERFTDELGIFSEWFVARLLGGELPAGVEPVFNVLLDRITGLTTCCVHRDYHCRNLLFDPVSGRDPRHYPPDQQVDFTHIRTRGTLRAGMEEALALVGKRVGTKDKGEE